MRLMRSKHFLILFTVIVPMAGIPASQTFGADDVTFETVEFIFERQTYRIEIAQTWEQRQQGLMFRNHLSEHSAMLFVYPVAGYHRIWMKNTLIPLKVVWINDNEVVTHIQRLKPCEIDPCPSYGSDKRSRYIVEFHDNFNELQIGDRLTGISRLAQ